jgi:hypothetical protein
MNLIEEVMAAVLHPSVTMVDNPLRGTMLKESNLESLNSTCSMQAPG